VSATVAPSLQHVEADWLSAVLQDGGHATAAVRTVEVVPVAFTGATTDMARVHVAYEEVGEPGPSTIIAKIRGVKDYQVQMDQAMSLYARETHFYRQFADEVPVHKPTCYFIGDGDRTPLLLEDLASMRMGDQMVGMTLIDAEAVIDALGDLHARFWESPELERASWLASPAEGVHAAMVVQLVSSGAPAVAERFRGQVPDSVIDAVVETAPDWGKVLAAGATGPPTLVHNDCRLDNLFFGHDGRPRFIDWQVTARIRGTQDVGNLLAGSMDADDLHANWERLLRRYHDRLLAGGVKAYSFDQCVEHYRISILYPLGAGMALIGMMDIGDGRGLGDAIVVRCLKHIAALDSFAAL
jgi:Ecdysteroid kinase-like family